MTELAVNYLMMICSDGVPTPEKSAVMTTQLGAYVEEITTGGKYVYGDRLDGPETARTVRVRDGQTLVGDGPFAEAKEFIAGLDLLRCRDQADAIATAATHPVSWFHAIEVRPTMACDGSDALNGPGEALFAAPAPGQRRYVIFICVNGIPETDAEEAQVGREAQAWDDQLTAAGVRRFGVALGPPSAATTVRVRGGETLLSDGPFVESKEFLGGLVIVDVPSIEDAVELAASHPVARYHRIEVRPFSAG